MTKEDKELLLKDVCARLPYKVKVCDDLGRIYELPIGNTYLIDLFYENGDYVEPPIKPYLRSMNSMTEEEFREYNQNETCVLYEEGILNGQTITSGESVDWLNAHHFDFRGLIEKGLALEAPEDMYKTK